MSSRVNTLIQDGLPRRSSAHTPSTRVSETMKDVGLQDLEAQRSLSTSRPKRLLRSFASKSMRRIVLVASSRSLLSSPMDRKRSSGRVPQSAEPFILLSLQSLSLIPSSATLSVSTLIRTVNRCNGMKSMPSSLLAMNPVPRPLHHRPRPLHRLRRLLLLSKSSPSLKMTSKR